MQMPLSIREPAEEPVAVASGGFDPVVVAAVGATAPPAGLDPLGPPVAVDAVRLPLEVEGSRWAIRDNGNGGEGEWWVVEEERAESDFRFRIWQRRAVMPLGSRRFTLFDSLTL